MRYFCPVYRFEVISRKRATISFLKSSFRLLHSAPFSAHAIDMPFEVAVLDKLCQNKLFEKRHGAGIKSELFFKGFKKSLREYQISDTQGGGNGVGKGVEIEDPTVPCRKQCVVKLF